MYQCPGAHFLKAPETFRAREAILSSSVSKNGEVYTPETSCMKETYVNVKKMWIKQLCNRRVRDFTMAFQAWKVSGAFEKQGPGQKELIINLIIFGFNLTMENKWTILFL